MIPGNTPDDYSPGNTQYVPPFEIIKVQNGHFDETVTQLHLTLLNRIREFESKGRVMRPIGPPTMVMEDNFCKMIIILWEDRFSKGPDQNISQVVKINPSDCKHTDGFIDKGSQGLICKTCGAPL